MPTTDYPTAHKIEEIFQLRESPETFDKFEEYLAKNLHIKVMGNDHPIAGEHVGVDAYKDFMSDPTWGFIDVSKGVKVDVINVIGGGDSSWACVEMRTQAKTKGGKKWDHESAYVVCFNLDGKITKIRAYIDSAHASKHVDHHKETKTGS